VSAANPRRPRSPARRDPAQLRLTDALAPFASADLRRSVWQLTSTVVAFACLWVFALLSLKVSYSVTLTFAGPAAVMLVRLFIIQHDCAHRAFLLSRRANDVAGSILGVLTLTPHAYWRRIHVLHHAASGNLNRRGLGDIETLTVREYLALGRVARLRYRLFRNAFVVLVIGPAYQFFVHHRWPSNLPARWRREWVSVVLTNMALATIVWIAWQTIGLGPFLLVHLPITWIAGSIGIWLFYVQHQFEETYWADESEWSFEAASVAGSSYLDLPPLLHWCTGNIGFHHVHHLAPRIPNYRLSSSAGAHPALARATRITLPDAVRCLRLKLWDEDQQRLVGFDALAADRGGTAAFGSRSPE
jgi:acyl-lipid omega-6 desaturase (Delta-12 desaturase)